MPYIQAMNALVAVCRNCGKIETFEGTLPKATEAAKQSNRWANDADGFTICADGCTKAQDQTK